MCLVCAVALLVLVLSVLLLGVVGAGVVCLVAGAAALLVLVLCVLSLVLVGTGVVGTGDVCGAVVVVGCAALLWWLLAPRWLLRLRLSLDFELPLCLLLVALWNLEDN